MERAQVSAHHEAADAPTPWEGLLPVRKLIAYGLIVVVVAAITAWAWHRRRKAARLLRERHGPRQD